jgi:hypothetical protein
MVKRGRLVLTLRSKPRGLAGDRLHGRVRSLAR